MIQKNLYWENFLKMFQNGPIRKVITKKVIFEGFLIFSPAVGHLARHLEKSWKNFSKNRRSAIVITCYLIMSPLCVPACFSSSWKFANGWKWANTGTPWTRRSSNWSEYFLSRPSCLVNIRRFSRKYTRRTGGRKLEEDESKFLLVINQFYTVPATVINGRLTLTRLTPLLIDR